MMTMVDDMMMMTVSVGGWVMVSVTMVTVSMVRR